MCTVVVRLKLRVFSFLEYILHYKADGADTWREQAVSTSGNRYTLEGLRCGSGYRLYMTATNSLGTGEPGDVLALRTKGAGNTTF